MKEEIVLVGAGGHCLACIDVIEQTGAFRIAGLIDTPQRLGDRLLGYPILATDADLPTLAGKGQAFLVTIGQIKSGLRRREIFNLLLGAGGKLPVIVSPLAYVSRHSEIGKGTIVMHGATINAGAQIGCNCIINSQALVEHGAKIGDHCHIATGAIVNGEAKVGDGSFIGSMAMLREGISVGEQTIVGGGVTALRNIPPHTQVTLVEPYASKNLHNR